MKKFFNDNRGLLVAILCVVMVFTTLWITNSIQTKKSYEYQRALISTNLTAEPGEHLFSQPGYSFGDGKLYHLMDVQQSVQLISLIKHRGVFDRALLNDNGNAVSLNVNESYHIWRMLIHERIDGVDMKKVEFEFHLVREEEGNAVFKVLMHVVEDNEK